MFLGLRTVIHPAPDLAVSREFYRRALGVDPYFDEPFYVGFSVGGFELGLDPAADPSAGAVSYWGVGDAASALAHLLATGASERSGVDDVGGGIRVATVVDAAGAIFGIIENPSFSLPAEPPVADGPGR